MYYVKRTCTETPENGSNDLVETRPQPLSVYQQLPAYVLLGDPGAGKTTVFKHETGDHQDAFYVTARDLITFEDRPEWHDKTLFIDGLDEKRAGSRDARTPFDVIRTRLENLGHPHFRLSCREADWFGATDQEHLKSVSPDGQVTILHLDPLTEADIVEILDHNPRVPNTNKFMQQAKQRGLNELLRNPQILDMLVKAVVDNNWPETRKQTFELACQTIVREHNLEHRNATHTQTINERQQLIDAGFLCAAQLIAGNAGYALNHDMATNDFPYLGAVDHENSPLLIDVVRTKLFQTPVEDRVTPLHRHVAEYLAARYLAQRIDHAGLPLARILALITGEDGIVVAELRGLSAWLAALCKTQRSTIIDCDPLGVVLYGDIQNFNRQDKRRVLDGLQREATRYPWFRSAHWIASPFGALATPDMEEEFRDILNASDRSETHQALVDCVLDAMAYGTRFTSLNEVLLNIIRDATWWPGIRRTALKVVQRNEQSKGGGNIRLKALIEDIRNGTVADPDDDLLGYLLTELYPKTVTAAEVLDFLHAPKRRNYIGRYLMFWDHQLIERSSDADVLALLDGLPTRSSILQPMLDDHRLCDLTAELLVRGLDSNGESIDSERLYKWLGVATDQYGHPHADTMTLIKGIRAWLGAHPQSQKYTIGIALDHCAEKENEGVCLHLIRARLFHAELPADFGQWCLERLEVTDNEQIARYLLQEAVGTIIDQHGDAGLTLEIIQKIAAKDAKHNAWLNDMLFCHIEPERLERNERSRLFRKKAQEKKQEWLRFAKSYETELREGHAHPGLLYDMATAYFGHFADSKGETPIERLRKFLVHDEDLVQSTLVGLRHSLDREDVPKVTDIIQHYANNQTYLLGRSILAGLEENTRHTANYVLQLGDEQIRQAIAVYLTEGTDEDPDWYKKLLAARPKLVAEVMRKYVAASLHSNKHSITGLYALAYFDAYSAVARLVSLAMLKAFPVRCSTQQLSSLNELLTAALRHSDRQAFLTLIEKKLSLRSMNMAQHVRWLASGMIVMPDKYLQPLADYSEVNEKRVQHLAGFLANRNAQWSPLQELPSAPMGLLVRTIGRYFAPYAFDGAGDVSPAMSAANFVNRMINRLGLQPGQETSTILDNLSTDDELSRWHDALLRARFEQRAARREASFCHPDIDQVTRTLNNLSPANAADLAALTMHILQDLANQIRNGNTDDYCQFWNQGTRGQLLTSKHEDACRDALLSNMQQRLKPLGVDAQPEGHYADDKRADIRVSYGGTDGFEVPIEIKKNSHRKLWYAIHDQLIKQYSRDPRAHGHGIYLVFWFGADKTQPLPGGQRPHTAEELENRLRATLTLDESRKISICVINVAKPN